MTKEEIIFRMVEASKEDRERFFVVADTLRFQPNYKEHLEELENLKQQWRDMTELPDYPHIKWPMELPAWFPTVRFASCWEADYLNKTLEREAAQSEVAPH